MSSKVALLGWSLPAIESVQKMNKPYVVVSFPDFEPYAKENGIPFVSWKFDDWNEKHNALQLKELLDAEGAEYAVALYEETVEWAGAVNSLYRDDPRVLNRAYLFRNKSLMKRKAMLAGLRVGYFEEVYKKDDVIKFMDRLNEANLQLEGEEDAWVHLKPFSAAGTVGHKLLRSKQDIEDRIVDEDFPCMVESHLPGKEFSCEAFIHDGKIRFLNITEYVKLGFSNFIPCGAELQEKRPLIAEAMQKLVDSFGIKYGVIHPEWFLTEDNTISFGEVASRIPGGHIFELIQNAYGFDAIQALILVNDPKVSQEEIDAFFPKSEADFQTYAGSVMVYPKPGYIKRLQIPDELKEDPFFDHHTLYEPVEHKVSNTREGFGNHYGTVFFKGDDPVRMKELLTHYQDADFYGRD